MEPEKKNHFGLVLVVIILVVVGILYFMKKDKVEVIPENQEPIVTETPITDPTGSSLPPENIDRPAFGSVE